MNKRRFKRSILLTCSLLLLLAAVPVALTGRALRQAKRDQALIAAVDGNEAQAVFTALRNGADPNARSRVEPDTPVWQQIRALFQSRFQPPAQGETALNVALEPFHAYKQIMDGEEWHGRNPAIITALLDAGANPNIADEEDKQPPLVRVALYAPVELMQALLDHNAAVNVKDDMGWTPLMGAVSNDDPVKTNLMLRHGADVNARANDGMTALMLSVHRDSETIKLLLEHHADPTIADNAGNTPLQYAKEVGDMDDVHLLQRAGVRK